MPEPRSTAGRRSRLDPPSGPSAPSYSSRRYTSYMATLATSRRAFEKSLFHSVVFKLPVMVVNVQPVGILFGKYTNANTNAIHL